MADWFAKLMHKRQARSSRAIPGPASSTHARVRPDDASRDPRYDALVRQLRERESDDREAREKRQRWYRQSLEDDDAAPASSDAHPALPARLHRFRTRVPCSATPEARALLAQLGEWFPESIVTFPRVADGRQAVMLTESDGGEPRQIGWVDQCAQTDPALCNVRHQGLTVETDAEAMLILRFRYSRTAVRIVAPCEAAATSVEFAEIRSALDPRPADRGASPRHVWVTRPELETMDALQSRDYEAFYVRFKLEVQAGIWSSLSALLSTLPASRWHEGACYTVVREPDAASRRIHQRTVDDSGRAADIGADRVYDAAPATDILLLYLDGDILADLANIYFTLQSLDSADAWFLKEEFFTVIRRFWAGSQSLTSRYGSDVAAVVRMCQHALPMPAQAPLLKQDWTNLRQSLVDRYGEGGRKATRLVGDEVHRPRIGLQSWPFESFPPGEVNLGLRVIYRQEWRQLAPTRGEVIRTDPPALAEDETPSTGLTRTRRSVETTIEQGDATTTLDEIVNDALSATAGAMSWSRDRDGSIAMGVRPLAASTRMGLESECRASSDDTCTRLGDVMRRMAIETRDVTAVTVSVPIEGELGSSSSADSDGSADGAATRVYSRLQNRYEVLTRPVEIENVVLIAERLPSPAEIDLAWVRRHAWILAKVLLDESFRDALSTIRQEGRTPQRSGELGAKREALYEHVRANVMHYQRAIWQREDPQQRSMRYRRSGRKVPLEWRFELEAGSAMTIDELAARLSAPQVDGQFATYSGGREMELDELIDGGPIGYHGNYAIYRMRPELGDAELFSMLHFFKSPYLRPNRETGEPEVADPVQLQIAEHSGCAAAGEHTRYVAIDSDGVVIDVIRAVDRAREELEQLESASDSGDAAESHALVVASGFANEGLSANGHRAAADESAILPWGAAGGSTLIAGSRAPDAREQGVLAGGDGVSRLGFGAVAAALQPREPAILAPNDAARTPRLIAGAAALRPGESSILPARDGAPTPRARVGVAHDPANEGVIVPRDGSGSGRITIAGAGVAARAGEIHAPDAGLLRLATRATPASPRAEDRVIVAPDDGVRTPGLRAGARDPAGQGHERVILTRDDARLRLVSAAGAGTVQVHERRILARDHDRLRPSLFAR